MLNKKVIRYTLIAVFLTVFVFSSVMLFKTVLDNQKAEKQFDELASLATLSNETPIEAPVTSSNESTEQSPAEQTPPPITRNIALLNERNSDCVGWVYIKDTSVNYPVMYTPNQPEKYLRRDFYGKHLTAGVPFIDARCTLDSTNIIIYGHNMKNLSMFGVLRKYLDESYLQSHPTIEFETLNGCVKYDIIEVRKTDITDSWYTHNLDGNQDGKEYVTLSTCYGIDKNARLLIIAVKQSEAQ